MILIQSTRWRFAVRAKRCFSIFYIELFLLIQDPFNNSSDLEGACYKNHYQASTFNLWYRSLIRIFFFIFAFLFLSRSCCTHSLSFSRACIRRNKVDNNNDNRSQVFILEALVIWNLCTFFNATSLSCNGTKEMARARSILANELLRNKASLWYIFYYMAHSPFAVFNFYSFPIRNCELKVFLFSLETFDSWEGIFFLWTNLHSDSNFVSMENFIWIFEN